MFGRRTSLEGLSISARRKMLVVRKLHFSGADNRRLKVQIPRTFCRCLFQLCLHLCRPAHTDRLLKSPLTVMNVFLFSSTAFPNPIYSFSHCVREMFCTLFFWGKKSFIQEENSQTLTLVLASAAIIQCAWKKLNCPAGGMRSAINQTKSLRQCEGL